MPPGVADREVRRTAHLLAFKGPVSHLTDMRPTRPPMPPAPHRRLGRPTLAVGAAVAVGALAIVLAERRRPLRVRTQEEPDRTTVNLVMGATCALAMSAAEKPFVDPLARRAERRRSGLVQYLPWPAWARDLAGIVLMDYTFYLWHVLTHKVPVLWRFHLVHHVDLDMDASTALRFHAVDMVISTPWRAMQVAAIGLSPRGLFWWRGFFLLSILFHHSNLRLPERLERLLAYLLTTPRMHGTHHSAVQDETDSNWSSGLSLWDHLHGTFRLDVDQRDVVIGVPAFRDPAGTTLAPSLRMPFEPQRNAWRAGAGEKDP
jgi:sterol desaturase/sphingolipid hydroxylase (fatty acid hydroxylase superfamily)